MAHLQTNGRTTYVVGTCLQCYSYTSLRISVGTRVGPCASTVLQHDFFVTTIRKAARVKNARLAFAPYGFAGTDNSTETSLNGGSRDGYVPTKYVRLGTLVLRSTRTTVGRKTGSRSSLRIGVGQ